jgi:hypothetical protein
MDRRRAGRTSGGNSKTWDRLFASALLARSAVAVGAHNGHLFAPLKRKYHMNRHLAMTLGLAVILLVAMTGMATATSLIINDPSFENLGYPDGTPLPATPTPFQSGNFDGDGTPDGNNWISGNDFYSNDSISGQWAQVNGNDAAVEWRPAAGNFVAPIPDGSQVLGSASNSTWPTPAFGGEVAVTQTLDGANGTLGTLQPHTTYTVTVAIGKVLGLYFDGAYPGIADATSQSAIGNYQMDGWDAPDGTFQDVSYSFNSDDVIGHGHAVGNKLAVFIDFGGGVVIDNVRVTAVTQGEVPEPSSVVLLAAGALSLLAYAWRKRK